MIARKVKSSGKVKIYNIDTDENFPDAKRLLGVVSQEINEITALGVGAASFLHINKMPFENMKDFITQSETWNPNIDSKLRDHYLNKWNKAISKAKQWT